MGTSEFGRFAHMSSGLIHTAGKVAKSCRHEIISVKAETSG